MGCHCDKPIMEGKGSEVGRCECIGEGRLHGKATENFEMVFDDFFLLNLIKNENL